MLNTAKDRLEFNLWPLLGLSLALHLLALEVNLPRPQKPAPHQPIALMDAATLQRIKAQISPQQIVRSQPGGQKRQDPQSRFLGQRTQSFSRQSVAKTVDPYRTSGRGTPRGSKGRAQGHRPQPAQPKLHLSQLGKVVTGLMPKPRPPGGLPAGVSMGQPTLRGPASSNDFIEDIPLGDFTQLNTTEFKYFGFYQRIRKKLERYWGLSLRRKASNLHQQGRSIAHNENYITSLIVTINHQGQITQVLLQGTSGVRELDNAAIESFNKAGPFPNPPQEMMKQGQASIKWSFVVQG